MTAHEDLLSRAREMEAEDRPVEAAELYERALGNGDGDVETYLALAGLYLVCQDYGYQFAHGLSVEFTNRAWERFVALLDEAERRFGLSDRIEFWRLYGRWRALADDSGEQRIRQIYLAGNVPEACVLAGDVERTEWERRTRLLYESLVDATSIVGLDILSIAQSMLGQAEERRKMRP